MFTTLLLLTTTVFMQALIDDPKAVPSKPDVKAAIERFLASPGPGDDAKMINQFAQNSNDVMVGMSYQVLPWAAHKPEYKYSGALLTAFVAGNVKSQLDSGKNGDDPYAGVLGVIKAYEVLQKRDNTLKIPEIDEQIAMEKKGELKAWVDKAAAQAKKEHEGK